MDNFTARSIDEPQAKNLHGKYDKTMEKAQKLATFSKVRCIARHIVNHLIGVFMGFPEASSSIANCQNLSAESGNFYPSSSIIFLHCVDIVRVNQRCQNAKFYLTEISFRFL